MSRLEDLGRKYWVDALIALLAIAGMLELVVARDSAGDPPTARSAISASTQYFLARSSTRVTR